MRYQTVNVERRDWNDRRRKPQWWKMQHTQNAEIRYKLTCKKRNKVLERSVVSLIDTVLHQHRMITVTITSL